MRNITVRLDDVCPNMHIDRFKKCVKLIESYGIKGLIGIVPDNKDSDLIYEQEWTGFWDEIRDMQKRGWIIGMHGFNHTLDNIGKSLVSNRNDSEFAGVSYEQQLQKILLGLEILQKHCLNVKVFFAPAHSFDRNTIIAVKNAGIKWISDGRAHRIYERDGVIFIPCRVYGFPRKPKGDVTVALHTNSIGSEKFRVLESFLEKWKEYLVDYEEMLYKTPKWNYIQQIDEGIYIFIKMHKWKGKNQC